MKTSQSGTELSWGGCVLLLAAGLAGDTKPGKGGVLDWALVIVRNRLVGGRDLGIHLLSQIDSFCEYAAEDGVHVVQTVAMFLHCGHPCCLVVP